MFCYKNDLVYSVDVSDEKNWKMYRSFVEKKTLLLNYCLKNSFAEIVYNVLVVTNSC